MSQPLRADLAALTAERDALAAKCERLTEALRRARQRKNGPPCCGKPTKLYKEWFCEVCGGTQEFNPHPMFAEATEINVSDVLARAAFGKADADGAAVESEVV